MPLTLAKKRLASWLALLAILVSALAPTISRAMAPQDSAIFWTDICSAVGVKSIHVPTIFDADGIPIKGKGQGGHCPYCPTFAGTFALPAVVVTPFYAPRVQFAFALVVEQPPPDFHFFTQAQSRAPPLFT